MQYIQKCAIWIQLRQTQPNRYAMQFNYIFGQPQHIVSTYVGWYVWPYI